ncbi:MAG: hypothetical protein O210_OD1C00001G0092 [Parcubacteria bacterium RAAC4_OD1_1]|nr:MAG: hypothetical protein O210_OD1C00001G0092 [Parcubacteria bacterium RAAC4_OD1_1]
MKIDNKIFEKDIIFGDEGLEYYLLTVDEYLQLKNSIPRQKEKVLDYIKQ